MHSFFNNSFLPPFPEDLSSVCLGMGCFWGAERIFWNVPGVYTTAVGYAGGGILKIQLTKLFVMEKLITLK